MFRAANQKALSGLLILSIAWITLFGAFHFANNSTMNGEKTVAVSPCHQAQISKTTSSQNCQKTGSVFHSILNNHYYWNFFLSETMTFLAVIVSIAASPFSRRFKPPRQF